MSDDDDATKKSYKQAKDKATSKWPSMTEVTEIAGKLFKDVKESVTEIVTDYKSKREHLEQASAEKEKNAEELKKTKKKDDKSG